MDAKTQAIVDAARKRIAERAAQAAELAATKLRNELQDKDDTEKREYAALADARAKNDREAAVNGKLSAMTWKLPTEQEKEAAHWQRMGDAERAMRNQVAKPHVSNGSPELHAALNSLMHKADANQATSTMVFNAEQMEALELGMTSRSFCLIGAAGTGKTTVTQELISRLQRAPHMQPLSAKTKHLDKDAPGIVICGFTNKAVNNIRKRLPAHLQKHCITIHKLLEYSPVYYEEPDALSPTGMRTTMRFEATRNSYNPLPHISTIIFEESSMIGTDLYDEVINALPISARTQIILLGDLNQLPPVFGPSILGFKMAELKVVELTHVYRQALMSPIISLATAVRTNAAASGFKRPAIKWDDENYNQAHLPWDMKNKANINRGEHGILHIHPWKKRVEWEAAINMMKHFLPAAIEAGTYNPAEDMILCPFNKSFGTIELNRIIADYLGKKRGELVHEVIARYEKSYWAVGDRVLHDRHEAVIRRITTTPGYAGKVPAMASKTLDRWGNDPESGHKPNTKLTADEVLNALDNLAGADDDAKNLASHTITVYIPDLDKEETLNTAGTINQLLFGYALTVHKSQGSEWQRVFFFLHNSHATMLSRELVYTAITRAKHELYIICEGDMGKFMNSIVRAADRPVIPGIALADKISYFRGKAKERGRVAQEDME